MSKEKKQDNKNPSRERNKFLSWMGGIGAVVGLAMLAVAFALVIYFLHGFIYAYPSAFGFLGKIVRNGF